MKNNERIRLAGAKFVLLDECGEEIACAVTNCNGELLFDCLPFGKYFIKEVEAPCGFEKSGECVEVCICECSEHACVDFVNKRKKGSIKVIKIGC